MAADCGNGISYSEHTLTLFRVVVLVSVRFTFPYGCSALAVGPFGVSLYCKSGLVLMANAVYEYCCCTIDDSLTADNSNG